MTPTNEQITAAARALSNDNADVCSVNREDNWNIYGDSFRETARVALEAAMGVATVVDPRTLHAMAGDMRAEQTFLGSCRESCDDSGKIRWDRMQRVIDYLDCAALPMKSEPTLKDGWKLVPVEPTIDMVIDGFESAPSRNFSKQEDWEAYEAMSGCQQAAHRARLCYAAMLAAAPSATRE